MLSTIRYFFADVGHWIATHKLVGLLVLLVLAGAGTTAYLLTREDEETGEVIAAPAPQVVVQEAPEPEQPSDLGFPAFATKNTTRVAGADAIATAAAVALAVHPSTGGLDGPGAVTLVDAEDWAGGIAAASLVAAPVGAPILVSENGELPELTADTIRTLAPAGTPTTDGHEVFAIGDAARPDGFDVSELPGSNAAEVAAGIDRLRTRLAGEPEHIILTTSEDPAIAMPAAAWAARSGDPVLFAQGDALPEATRRALQSHRDAPVYVFAPASVIPAKVIDEIEGISGNVERVGAENPVENAIEFARYSSGSFGWNINDPGHGFVIASTSRPLDAAVAAPLSASGSWGPLLLTEDGEVPPNRLRGYLLDLKPGYEDDPTRAVYNHIWVIGDTEAISVDFQAQVDELAEVAPVRSGTGATTLGPTPGAAESQPDDNAGSNEKDKKQTR